MFFKTLVPILSIAAAIGLYFIYIEPTRQEILVLQAEEVEFDRALLNARELEVLKERLDTQRKAFTAEDIEQLDKLLPKSIDTIRLVNDVAVIASKYGMGLKGVVVTTGRNQGRQDLQENKSYTETMLSFFVEADYNTLLDFIRDLERSLRIVDVNSIQFGIGESFGRTTYSISITTYSLD